MLWSDTQAQLPSLCRGPAPSTASQRVCPMVHGPQLRRNLEKPKAAERVRARCSAGDSPVLSLDQGQAASFGDSGVQHTKPCLEREEITAMPLGRQARHLLSCCRDKQEILKPCEQQPEFQPCQTDSAAFGRPDKCPGAMSDPGKCRAIRQGKPVAGGASTLFSPSLPACTVPRELFLIFLLFLPAVWTGILHPTR